MHTIRSARTAWACCLWALAAGAVAAAEPDGAGKTEAAEKLMRSRQYEAAKVILDAVIEEAPGNAEAICLWSECHEELGKTREAIEGYKRALSMLVDQEDSRKTRALIHRCKEKLEDLDQGRELILEYADKLEREGQRKLKGRNEYAWETVSSMVALMRGEEAATEASGDTVEAHKIVLINTHEFRFGGRRWKRASIQTGTTKCNVILLKGDQTVWTKKDVDVNWIASRDASTTIRLPKKSFERIRIEIIEWKGECGGLTELQVFRGQKNIAQGCPVSASAVNHHASGAEAVTDGVLTSARERQGYWLLPMRARGWIEVDLVPDDDETAGRGDARND